MKKNNAKKSLQGIKRYKKNLARKKRKSDQLDTHVDWLETLMLAGKDIDMDKVMMTKKISKLTGKQEDVMRDSKSIKLIISRLVSRGNLRNKK
jgi:hypothetical protein